MAPLNQTRRGAALLEFALVLPLLLLLLLGLLEYGWLFLKSQSIANAARQGVRVGVTVDATASQVTAAVAASMTAAGLQTSGYTVTLSPTDPTTLQPGELLSVTVRVPYANIALVGSGFLPGPTNLRSTVVMSREGP